jgi:hypothetical protein
MNGPTVNVREHQWRETFAKPDDWFCFVAENAAGELVAFTKGAKSDNPEQRPAEQNLSAAR